VITETSVVNSVINPLDTEGLKAQFEAGSPHRYFMIDDFLDADFAHQCVNEFPSFEEAQKLGHEFRAVNERLKVQITDSQKFRRSVLRLHQTLASTEFLNLISCVTGIPKLLADSKMTGGGMHQTGPSGHLDVHVDFNRLRDPPIYRRLNILVFLNKNWQPEWGGNFELWDKAVRQMQQSFEPIFNRCVVFETTDESFHGVSAVKCPPGETRKSFAGYYYTAEAPAYYTGVDHSTIFRPRPDEYLKGKVLMPLEQTRRWMQTSITNLKRKLRPQR
jgi:Rps23 Pro-64 3,4-dihydroxylase Tpa1-like proline 4-hydroxylase